jgi:hypothetical protein
MERPMTQEKDKPAADAGDKPADCEKPATDGKRPKEIGGRDGPDPTRYGDWEKAGRCIDF